MACALDEISSICAVCRFSTHSYHHGRSQNVDIVKDRLLKLTVIKINCVSF